MESGCRVVSVDGDSWRQSAASFRDHNYRHVWDFGLACAERVGASCEHVAVMDEGEVIGLADVRIRKLPVLRLGIAYVNGGPLVRRENGRDRERLERCLQALTEEYIERRRFTLRVRPPMGSREWNEVQAGCLAAAGYGLTTRVPRYRTLVVDLDRSLEELRKNLKQKWRNGLNQAERNDLVLTRGTSLDLFTQFSTLFDEMLRRKPFHVELGPSFYRGVQERSAAEEKLHIGIVKGQDGSLLAGQVTSLLGDTCVYILGASSERGMQLKASYLLQWNIMTVAREHGCRWYDLGGIDPENNPGVFHFKRGVGGSDETAPGPYERTPGRLRSTIVRGAEQAYKLLKRRS